MNDVVTRFKNGALTKYKPQEARIRLGGLKGAIAQARRLQDKDIFREAVAQYAAEQAAFVAWWDATVRDAHRPLTVDARQQLSADDATAQTGIRKEQVSRWRAKTSKLEGYIDSLCGLFWKRVWADRTREDLHAADEARVRRLRPKAGTYRTLVADPPWDYDWLSLAGRAKPGYATMTREELLELVALQWAHDECHLYLWTTNNFMARACELMAVWGFQHKTVLTWVKPRWGLGSYFRNQTEHVLFGVRGELRTRCDNISTIIEGPIGGHSEKPDSFYDLVGRASYLPAGELFQRKERDGFENVFI